MTTQSTRDKLTAVEAQQAVITTALQSEQAEREAAELHVAAEDLLLQQQAEAMEALMLQLAAARATDPNPSPFTPPSPTYTPQDSPLSRPMLPPSSVRRQKSTRTTLPVQRRLLNPPPTSPPTILPSIAKRGNTTRTTPQEQANRSPKALKSMRLW